LLRYDDDWDTAIGVPPLRYVHTERPRMRRHQGPSDHACVHLIHLITHASIRIPRRPSFGGHDITL
jgi:hypothetical protein